ncbi:MAG: AMIN domain-containing protein [Pseudomonadota bacterium]
MKIGYFRALVCTITLFCLPLGAATKTSADEEDSAKTVTSELTNMSFYQVGEQSRLEMVFDRENVEASKFHVAEDKQIIIDLKNVKAAERVLRAFDTSEFTGSVVFVSAYKKPGKPSDTRVAVQLRDNVRSILSQQENKVILNIENRFGVFSQNQVEGGKTIEEKTAEADENIGNLLVPKSDKVEDILENLTLSGKKKYVGKKVTLNVRDMGVEDILKIIADASGFNIIIADDVKAMPKMTLTLTNIPWD